MIVHNKIQCNSCKEIIESKFRNDFVWCKCKKVAVDGGRDYLRRVGGRADWTDMSLVMKDPPPPKVADTRHKPAGRPEHADTAKDRVLKALQKGVCTALDLASPAVGGLRYTARIAELREEGWAIKTQSIEGKSYCEYVLLGRKEDQQDKRQIPLF